MFKYRICMYNLVAVSDVKNLIFKEQSYTKDSCQEKGEAENDPELNLNHLPSINKILEDSMPEFLHNKHNKMPQ